MNPRRTALWLLLGVLCKAMAPVQADPLDQWQLRSGQSFNRVRYVGNLFVALGENGSLATSEDGKTWVGRNSGSTASLRGVACGTSILPPTFGQPIYVVVGSDATILTSTNGTNWSTVATTNNCDLNDIDWTGNYFVAVTTRALIGQPNALRSSSGNSWTPITIPGATPDGFGSFVSSAVKHANGVLIVAGGVPFTYDLWRSTTGGATWTMVADSQQTVQGITFGNNRFFLAGLEGAPMVSTNAGLNWYFAPDSVVCNPPPGLPWCMAATDVAFGNGMFAIARHGQFSSSRSSILTSVDSANWVVRSAGNFVSVTFGKGTFVAAGDEGIYQSGNVATPSLSIFRTANQTNLILRSTGEIGRTYRLQSSTNSNNWDEVLNFTNMAPTAELTISIDPMLSTKLFRVSSP